MPQYSAENHCNVTEVWLLW